MFDIILAYLPELNHYDIDGEGWRGGWGGGNGGGMVKYFSLYRFDKYS